MNRASGTTACVIAMWFGMCVFTGCQEAVPTGRGKLTPSAELGQTIGSLAEVLAVESIPVEGYGLVGGLRGTGSSECPPEVRRYLVQYILTQLPNRSVDPDRLINSRSTAVVELSGMMPTAAVRNRHFDVGVAALLGTQTTSLEDGWLYKSDLRAEGGAGPGTRALATVEGPVFIDTVGGKRPDRKGGYILAGGTVLNEYGITLAPNKPDYMTAVRIRDRLNARFGPGTANAISPAQIEVKVPAGYGEQKEKFVAIVKAMYLDVTGELVGERVRTFAQRLAVSKEKQDSEIALEAIGNESLGKLAVLLKSSDEEVRLRAARCMLNLGSDEGLETLREIATAKRSRYRVEALEAIGRGAPRNVAVGIARGLVQDGDFEVRLAAYEQLRRLSDVSVSRKVVGRSFYLEQVAIAPTADKVIYVSRSGQPRIVLFGSPRCRDNIFVQSSDGDITINAAAGQEYVSIIRKHPTRADVVLPMKSSFELGDIIETLCEEPLKKGEEGRAGLGVSYAEMIGLLKRMCERGAVRAEFRAGPLPKIGPIVKK